MLDGSSAATLAGVAAPAQMVGEPRRSRAARQRLQPLQMLAIERLSGAEVHGNSMLHDLVLLQDLVENRQRASAVDHIVFGDDLEPVHHRLPFENVRVVRNAQPNSDAVFGEAIEAVCRHVHDLDLHFTRPGNWGGPDEAGPLVSSEALNGSQLGAVGGAAALALAGVLALAAVVPGLAAALAFGPITEVGYSPEVRAESADRAWCGIAEACADLTRLKACISHLNPESDSQEQRVSACRQGFEFVLPGRIR